jgi:hypothetical protein
MGSHFNKTGLMKFAKLLKSIDVVDNLLMIRIGNLCQSLRSFWRKMRLVCGCSGKAAVHIPLLGMDVFGNRPASTHQYFNPPYRTTFRLIRSIPESLSQ